MNKYYITNATFNRYIAVYFKNNENTQKVFSDFLYYIDVEETVLRSIYSDVDIDLLISRLKAAIYCKDNELNAETVDNFEMKAPRFYVFNTPPPAYHFKSDCSFLSKDFHNLEIPIEIIHKGQKEIDAFLKYADDNKKIFNEDPEKFKMLATTRFLLTNAFNDVIYPNTYMIDLELSIKDSILEAFSIAKDNKNIKNVRYASFKKVKEKGQDVNDWFLQYKIPIYKRLELEIKNFTKLEMYFNEDFLKKLGLRPCAACCI